MKVLIGLLVLVITLVLLVVISSRVQLFLLHKMYSLGSGMDDGAIELFMQNKHRYKTTVLDLLNADEPETYKAQASFLFGELMLDEPEINQKIQNISQSHPNKHIRCFWFDVLDGRFENVRISGGEDDKFAAYIIRDKGSRCE